MVDKRPFRKNPGVVPVDLDTVKATCIYCGFKNDINWVEDLLFPKEPIELSDASGHWVPVSFPITCLDCKKDFDFNTPIKEKESTWNLFGDEAARIITRNGKQISFFCISLVGLHKDKHDIAKNKIQKLKLVARPDVAPELWPHHFTQIWSDSGEDRVFSFSSVQEKIFYGQKLSKLIKNLKPHLSTFNFSNAIILPENKKDRASALKHQKQDIYKQALLTTLSIFRENNKGIRWTFDNIKDTTDGTKKEGWADECFLGLQYTRLFTYLCAGIAVHPPKFVQPGSHFLLEIADFISFCMAREFQRVSEGKNSEIPSGLMGKMINQMVEVNGNPFWFNELGSISIRRYFQ